MSQSIQQVLDLLALPFPAKNVKWRVGATDNKDNPTKGIALAYIDARDVMYRLDDTLGADGWQDKITRQDGATFCSLGICLGGEWTWKTDSAGDSDVEAEKGAASDAFKRAAAKWGIGRYLYLLPTVWHPVEKKGRSTFLVKPYPELPTWATSMDKWLEMVKRRRNNVLDQAARYQELMGTTQEGA